jgi:hypothetical protein
MNPVMYVSDKDHGKVSLLNQMNELNEEEYAIDS